MIRVYISGPITGDPYNGPRNAILAAKQLRDAGMSPLVPHLTILEALVAGDRPHADWLKADLAWVSQADALLRLPGESKGSDQEVTHALNHNIPVYFSVDELLRERGIA